MSAATDSPAIAPADSDTSKQSRLLEFLFEKTDIGVLVWLLILNLLCFQRTLSGYFLADDFVHIPYLVKVFHGHPELLLANFYSNWMQAQGTEFYRPFISITLALDYALYKTNAVGYHVTNFLYQYLATIFLFLTTRRLFRFDEKSQGFQLALVTSSFFAVYPLHAEVVSWIIARVDSVATTFTLASAWLYLRYQDGGRRSNLIASVAAFWVALLSKEMAITLPPTLALLEFIRSDQKTIGRRLKESLGKTWLYWLNLVFYIVVRTAALGTISGGYAGSIGAGLSNSFLKRFFGDNSFSRLLFPLNAELGSGPRRIIRVLRVCYGIGIALTIVKVVSLAKARNLKPWICQLLFALGWFVIALLPTYQVWNLTESLQGSRFAYMATAPLCLVLAVLFAPAARSWNKWANIACGALCLVIVFTLQQLAYHNNSAWAHASNGLRAFRREVQTKESLLQVLQNGKASDLLIANIPQKHQGAHMLYNAATLSVLLDEPLSSKGLYKHVITFEPATFGDADLVNISRLRRLLAQTQVNAYRWNEASLKLEPVHLQLSGESTNLTLEPTSLKPSQQSTTVVSPVINQSALAADFLDIYLEQKSPVPTSVLTVWWNSKEAPAFNDARKVSLSLGNKNELSYPVSEHKNWVFSQDIQQLRFDLPPGVTLKRVTLRSGEKSIARLWSEDTHTDEKRTMVEDVAGISRPGHTIGYFAYDISHIPNADHGVLEVSQPDSWFEHYTGTFRDTKLSEHALFTVPLKKLQNTDQSIPANKLGRAGFYEIRVAALDKKNAVVGYVSDPIVLQYSAEDVR